MGWPAGEQRDSAANHCNSVLVRFCWKGEKIKLRDCVS